MVLLEYLTFQPFKKCFGCEGLIGVIRLRNDNTLCSTCMPLNFIANERASLFSQPRHCQKTAAAPDYFGFGRFCANCIV